jgi:glutathione S-transferase
MARTLYDLAAADDKRRFSPYCWRIKMALAHKELEVETVPWRFTEKDVIAFSGQGRVPVLVDGDKVVADSWAIANELEARYPDCKSLFGDVSAHSPTLFVASWVDGVLQPAI